jgi:hypothetical protein
MTAAVERKYALSRIAAGDYVFPSNDGNTIWRVSRYTEGPSSGLDHLPRDRDYWGLWKWHEPVSTGGFIDTGSFERWDLVDSLYDTRAEAINAALAL